LSSKKLENNVINLYYSEANNTEDLKIGDGHMNDKSGEEEYY